jgi:hypothetical protein
LVLHGWSPLGQKYAKSSKEKTCVRTGPGAGLVIRWLNAKARLGGRAFFFPTVSILTDWVKLKCQLWRIYFWPVSDFDLFGLGDFGLGFQGFGGLTFDFWAETGKYRMRGDGIGEEDKQRQQRTQRARE